MPDNMQSTLVNPNQLRHYGTTIQNNLYSNAPMSLQSPDEDFICPLLSEGTVIYIDTWTPSQEELDMLPKIVLSSPHEWDPQRLEFPKMRKSTEEEIELRNLSQVRSLKQDSLYDDTVPGDFLPDCLPRVEDTVVFDNNTQSSKLISSYSQHKLALNALIFSQ
jgi:hypothetical protein